MPRHVAIVNNVGGNCALINNSSFTVIRAHAPAMIRHNS